MARVVLLTTLMSDLALEGASPAMRAFGRLLAQAARHDVPVLLVGETGAGKTTFGRALHAMSARAALPFVRVDCPAATGDLSMHADAARTGTLFLDEVAELSPAAQASALKFLERRLPSVRPEPFDSGRSAASAQDRLREAESKDERAPPALAIRVVASTRHDLDVEMRIGRLRKDLFYRLCVCEIRIPPLRERTEDILPLARTFVASLASKEGCPPPELSPDLERALVAYSWPGNVSELMSVLERLVILAPGGSLDVSALPERIPS
ncbi:MAG TPA: sigma 54-interacting transcriptional regulator [Anaeromyxobacteraceae bacterium]|nr:sigma 54-interacting transcriptional regulator [Anaeromyxobacteraceae bacterium]